MSRSGLRRWLDDTRSAWRDCNLDADPADMTEADARRAVDCMRVAPEDPESVFAAERLGILVTGVQYAPFPQLFQRAYGDGWLPHYTEFKARVGMPKGNYPEMTPEEFATIRKWFQQDLVSLDAVLQEPPPPSTCEESFDTAAISAHVDEMRYEGWGAVNAENGIRMFGCSGDDPLACFGTGFADRSREWGNGIGTVRELRRLDFRTSFWTRSSADGRYVGNGGGKESRATITDLATGTDIGVEASYDPGFFPDNSGFIFQGSTGGAGICAQSLLAHDTEITFDEPECITARGINLYQHVARGLRGGDYFIINSQFTSDGGGGSSDPSAHFNASSTMKLTPMIFDGTRYEPMRAIIVDSPYEGDSVLSPSGELVGSRLAGPEGRPLGYVIRRMDAQRFGETYRVSIDTVLGTVCMSGAKMSFSFDERFFVTHHYEEGSADIFLVDMLTGTRHQVTSMPEGTRALFPHFRSDGWFYFLVKSGDGEYVAASDAALRLAAE